MGVTLDIILLGQLSVQTCVCCACAGELGVGQWGGWELCTGSMAQLSMDHQQVTPCQPESIQVRDLQLCEQLEVGVLNGWGPEPCLPILCTVFTRVRGVVDRTDLQAESPGEHVESAKQRCQGSDRRDCCRSGCGWQYGLRAAAISSFAASSHPNEGQV